MTEDIPSPEDRLRELNSQISEVKEIIRSLNHEISELKMDIFRYENANILYRVIKPATIPEKSPSTEDFVEMNEEHQNILREGIVVRFSFERPSNGVHVGCFLPDGDIRKGAAPCCGLPPVR